MTDLIAISASAIALAISIYVKRIIDRRAERNARADFRLLYARIVSEEK